MRIAVIATGSRGDVQPYIALAKGLAGAGHAVRIITHHNFAGLVGEHGLELWPVEVNVQEIAQSLEMSERIEKGSFLAIMAQMAKAAQGGAVSLAEAGLAAGRGMDLFVAGMGGMYTGLALAQKLNIPLLQAHLVPFTPTSAFASPLASGLPVPGGPLNRMTHYLARQLIWQGFRSADRLARREVLDLPPAPFIGPYRSEYARGLPILYGFSPSVIPTPPDWQDEVEITGYWFLDPQEGWAPPSALLDFLDAGPPPVYIGFGSMSDRKPEQTAELVVQALRRTNQRAILLSGWGGLQPADLSQSIFLIDSIPHAWLFPRTAAVVHHGGAGTTGAGLRSGVPSVIIPFFGDQPFWGQRVAELGVGPAPVPRRQLTVERLAYAIRTAVTDEQMRRRAAELGAKIQAEDGVARAVEIIQKLEGRPPIRST